MSNLAWLHFLLSFTKSYHCQWPWAYFKVTALCSVYAPIQLSWNFALAEHISKMYSNHNQHTAWMVSDMTHAQNFTDADRRKTRDSPLCIFCSQEEETLAIWSWDVPNHSLSGIMFKFSSKRNVSIAQIYNFQKIVLYLVSHRICSQIKVLDLTVLLSKFYVYFTHVSDKKLHLILMLSSES